MGSDTMFSNKMDGRIVTDDAVAMQRLPSVDVKDISNQSKSVANQGLQQRCDSGFNSGLESHFSQRSEPQVHSQSKQKFEETNKIPYNRYDSGIATEFESLHIDPTKPQFQQTQIQIGDLPELEKQVNDDFIQCYQPDKDGDCQLHLAIASGFTEVVFALIRMAPHSTYLDIQNNEIYAPLHMASKRGHLECAEALLRSISVEELKEASVVSDEAHIQLHNILNLKNYNGEHSIHLATFGQHYNFIRFLSWSGADMNATEGRSGKTALHYAVNKRDLNLVGLLASPKVHGGCEVHLNHRDWAGRTPVQCAAINGDADIVALLTSLPNCDTAQWESDEDFEFDTDEAEEEIDNITYNDIEVTNSRVLESRA